MKDFLQKVGYCLTHNPALYFLLLCFFLKDTVLLKNTKYPFVFHRILIDS